MSQQPEPTSSTLEGIPATLPEQAAGAPRGSASQPVVSSEPETLRIPRWLVRVELLLRVMLRMYVGLFTCYLPWWPSFWDRNPLFMNHPTIAGIAMNGAVRGLVSGLGLLNLWVALQDILGRREMRRER